MSVDVDSKCYFEDEGQEMKIAMLIMGIYTVLPIWFVLQVKAVPGRLIYPQIKSLS